MKDDEGQQIKRRLMAEGMRGEKREENESGSRKVGLNEIITGRKRVNPTEVGAEINKEIGVKGGGKGRQKKNVSKNSALAHFLLQ